MLGIRKIADEADARRCLDDARIARQTLRQWANEHGVDGRSLHAWKVNLGRSNGSPRRRRRPGAQATGLVELVPAPATVATSGRYILEIDGARVEFGDDASSATLRRVVEALRSC